MTTIEIIEGKPVKISWTFVEIVERHDSHWCEWIVEGEDEEGNMYSGDCGGDARHPDDFHSDVENIELVTVNE